MRDRGSNDASGDHRCFGLAALAPGRPCDEDIRIALRNLPKDLNEIFNRALRRILAGSHFKEAQKVFTWVNAARRPLNLRELREAIAIKVAQKYSDKARQCNDMDKIATWCQNLVYVDEETLVVQVIHTSVRTLLLEKSRKPFLSMFHIDVFRVHKGFANLCESNSAALRSRFPAVYRI